MKTILKIIKNNNKSLIKNQKKINKKIGKTMMKFLKDEKIFQMFGDVK